VAALWWTGIEIAGWPVTDVNTPIG
jgi:hypothetical protein